MDFDLEEARGFFNKQQRLTFLSKDDYSGPKEMTPNFLSCLLYVPILSVRKTPRNYQNYHLVPFRNGNDRVRSFSGQSTAQLQTPLPMKGPGLSSGVR
ncbi:hypothetical protein NPIL_168051 [Nephila pilipes]|uniref:Uncharacterized protein n=1 Tax=Nephila pilipes TaxID=299642 RepID=A0A8X6MU31_NEPPI|nr:hypothetical protein NPIL_168051 [Nephila pilipes]